MKTTNIERRNLTHEFRVSPEGEQPKISGYASLTNSPYDCGYWIEQIDAHAFNSVLAKNPDVRGLWNHNPDFVLGRSSARTLQLSLDDRGLAYVIDPPDTSVARDLMVSMRRGDVRESSFAFIVLRDQWTDNPDGSVTRTILEFEELLDVSPVTYPANNATSSQVRSLPHTMPAEMRSRFTGSEDQRALNPDQCTCMCPQCRSGACGICSADPQCEGAERETQRNADRNADTLLRLRLAEAEAA
jgi:uncharacterized protein